MKNQRKKPNNYGASTHPVARPGESEIKYVFDRHIGPQLALWLSERCVPDGEYPYGTVSSVYYDTPWWHLLREKLNSDYLKTKFRIRWYSDLNGKNPGPCGWIEAKHKVGSSRFKKRVQLNESGQKLSETPLESPYWLDFAQNFSEMGFALPGSLVPVFEIRYQRLRFVEPTTGARICIDNHISAPRINPLMLSATTPAELTEGVFELKGNQNTLPKYLRQLSVLGCRKRSFSKYLNCYVQLNKIIL